MKYLLLFVILFIMPMLPRILNQLFGDEENVNQRSKNEKISEALKILELPESYTEDEVKAAHKRLIQKNHPDTGGSQYLASKINEARDILLENLKQHA